MNRRLLLVNQGKSDNIGDQLINSVLMDLLSTVADVTHISYGGSKGNRLKQNEYTYNRHRNSLLRSLKNSIVAYPIRTRITEKKIFKALNSDVYDAIIIGGGELIKSKHTFLSNLNAWANYSKKTNTKLILFGISSDRDFTKVEMNVLKRIMRTCKYVNVRDTFTKKYIEEKCHIDVSYSPDVVFLYKKIIGHGQYKKKKQVAINVFCYEKLVDKSRYDNREKYYEYWERVLSDYIRDREYEIIAFSTNIEDVYDTNQFCEFVKGKYHISQIDVRSDICEKCVVASIAESELVITGRMHAMILAKQYSTKISPFIFKNKIRDFVIEWGNKQIIDYSEIEKQIRSEIETIDKILNKEE